MTHREFLEQLAEQGQVNDIIDKCLDLQHDIEVLEQELYERDLLKEKEED